MPTFNPPRCRECGNHRSPYSKFVHPQGDAQRNIRPEIYKFSSMVSVLNNAHSKFWENLPSHLKDLNRSSKCAKTPPAVRTCSDRLSSLSLIAMKAKPFTRVKNGTLIARLSLPMSHLTVTSNMKFPMVYHAALTYSLYFDHSTASQSSWARLKVNYGELSRAGPWVCYAIESDSEDKEECHKDKVWLREWVPRSWDRGIWSCGGLVFEWCRRWADLRRGWRQ